MRPQREVRGDRAAKVHLVKADPHLRTTGTACFAYAAADVQTTTDINAVTCVVCIKRAPYR